MPSTSLRIFAIGLCIAAMTASAGSFYAVVVRCQSGLHHGPSGGDDTALLQQAIDEVRDTTGQGIVFVAPGNYRITNTIYIWPSIRVIGVGKTRSTITLPANTPNFADPMNEKLMFFFAGRSGCRRLYLEEQR